MSTVALETFLGVAHNVGSDVDFLQNSLLFDIKSILSITAIIDTEDLGRSVFNLPKQSPTLKHTLSSSGIETTRCHNSGNDAIIRSRQCCTCSVTTSRILSSE